jgi:hypothetical protein
MDHSFKIAALCTAYWPASHADVIVTRWMQPYPGDERPGVEWVPSTRIASLYVMQHQLLDGAHQLGWTPAERKFTPGVELGNAYAKLHGVPMFTSIDDALTLGSGTLAVDAVLLIGEHGNFAFNDLGQHLYPRKEMFDAVTACFERSGRSVPVFVDKHLSWNGQWARAMAATAHRLGFPLMAGSSLPYSLHLKPELQPRQTLSEGVALFYVGPEVYGFHSLEGMQSFFEHSTGGNSGIAAIRAFSGDAVWEAMDNGAWSRTLFDAALAACPSAQPGPVRTNCAGSAQHGPSPSAFLIERTNGFRETHINLQGHIEDFALAIQTASGTIHANRWEAGSFDDFFSHFAILNRHIQRFFLERREIVPIRRALLTSLSIERCMHALKTPGTHIETPDLNTL